MQSNRKDNFLYELKVISEKSSLKYVNHDIHRIMNLTVFNDKITRFLKPNLH